MSGEYLGLGIVLAMFAVPVIVAVICITKAMWHAGKGD